MVIAFTNEHSRDSTPESAHYGTNHLFTPIPILAIHLYRLRPISAEWGRRASISATSESNPVLKMGRSRVRICPAVEKAMPGRDNVDVQPQEDRDTS
jgi:hypothetical protein